MTTDFIKIADAMHFKNQKVNFTGVVAGTTLPAKSKGPDYYCTMKIIDESRSSRGISVNFFAENLESLPLNQLAGDIIHLFQVVIRKPDFGEIFAVFYKDNSSFALFEGKYSNNFVPYQVSLRGGVRMIDEKSIIDLRKLLVHGKLDTGPKDLSWLIDLREGEHCNLACKVLHTCEVTKDKWILYVWDGTDAPSVTIQAKLEDEMENPLPLQLENDLLSRDILKTFPTVGTILRVIVDQCKDMLGLHFLNGRWVKLIEMKCESIMGIWRGTLLPYSKLGYMPDDADLALQRQRVYDERVQTKCGLMPFQCFPLPPIVTEVDYPDKPYATLMDALTYPEATWKFKCVVRVVASYPSRAEDFRDPNGMYRIRLSLEDPTARIHAFLNGENGDKFFGGCPSVEEVRKKRNILLGVCENDNGEESDAPRNPPWVQCCIFSYYLDKNDIWGSRHFIIFGTSMMG